MAGARAASPRTPSQVKRHRFAAHSSTGRAWRRESASILAVTASFFVVMLRLIMAGGEQAMCGTEIAYRDAAGGVFFAQQTAARERHDTLLQYRTVHSKRTGLPPAVLQSVTYACNLCYVQDCPR
eukprot:345635-Rhodomonas_salina.3